MFKVQVFYQDQWQDLIGYPATNLETATKRLNWYKANWSMHYRLNKL